MLIHSPFYWYCQDFGLFSFSTFPSMLWNSIEKHYIPNLDSLQSNIFKWFWSFTFLFPISTPKSQKKIQKLHILALNRAALENKLLVWHRTQYYVDQTMVVIKNKRWPLNLNFKEKGRTSTQRIYLWYEPLRNKARSKTIYRLSL